MSENVSAGNGGGVGERRIRISTHDGGSVTVFTPDGYPTGIEVAWNGGRTCVALSPSARRALRDALDCGVTSSPPSKTHDPKGDEEAR